MKGPPEQSLEDRAVPHSHTHTQSHTHTHSHTPILLTPPLPMAGGLHNSHSCYLCVCVYMCVCVWSMCWTVLEFTVKRLVWACLYEGGVSLHPRSRRRYCPYMVIPSLSPPPGLSLTFQPFLWHLSTALGPAALSHLSFTLCACLRACVC